MHKKQSPVYLIAISFISTLGGFLFGYDTAVISGCNSFLQLHFQLTPSMLGWVVSSALLGTILGCIISATITDRFGRKKALILSTVTKWTPVMNVHPAERSNRGIILTSIL